jgi:hypothetical protein
MVKLTPRVELVEANIHFVPLLAAPTQEWNNFQSVLPYLFCGIFLFNLVVFAHSGGGGDMLFDSQALTFENDLPSCFCHEAIDTRMPTADCA